MLYYDYASLLINLNVLGRLDCCCVHSQISLQWLILRLQIDSCQLLLVQFNQIYSYCFRWYLLDSQKIASFEYLEAKFYSLLLSRFPLQHHSYLCFLFRQFLLFSQVFLLNFKWLGHHQLQLTLPLKSDKTLAKFRVSDLFGLVLV